VDVVEVDAFKKAVKPLLKKAVRARWCELERTAFFSKEIRAKGMPAPGPVRCGKRSSPSLLRHPKMGSPKQRKVRQYGNDG